MDGHRSQPLRAAKGEGLSSSHRPFVGLDPQVVSSRLPARPPAEIFSIRYDSG